MHFVQLVFIGSEHFGVRDYDPSLGRWLSKDPLRFSGSVGSFYAYASGDPVNHTDRSGRTDEEFDNFLQCVGSVLKCRLACSVPESEECWLCIAEAILDPENPCKKPFGWPDPPPPPPPCPPGQVPGGWGQPLCVPDPDEFPQDPCEPDPNCDPRTQSCMPAPAPF